MNVHELGRECVRHFRCPYCRKHGDPATCKHMIREKQDGFTCTGFRSDADAIAREMIRRAR